jgi:hypothetical protein
MKNRMMKKNIYTLFTISTLLICSCNKNKESNKIIDIEKEFTFHLWEQLDGNGGSFQLIARTIQNQNCGGTRIGYTQNTIGSKMTLTLNSLVAPNLCNGKLEPAVDTINFGNMTNGTYKLSINLKDAILNDGTLVVDEKKYTLNMFKLDGIDFPEREILRVPKGAVWGFVSYDNGQEAKLNKFNDNLLRISTPLSISQGDYGYFNVKTSSVEVKAVFDSKKQNVRQLLINLSGSRTDLQNLIQEYRTQGLDIKIFTFDGKTL